MLQDLSYGRLENEFYNREPQPEDPVLCFQNQQILLKRDEQGGISLPTVAEAEICVSGSPSWFAEGFRYVFRMQGNNYFLWLGELEENNCNGYCLEPIRLLRYQGLPCSGALQC